ncbi:hypothetical protein CC86DRAFT_374938 [Ophiobolus disseminans]|uniref:Asl1-like glycosyl hydrolase catalytic domain-containing protein n=1 Tax=Ophiobolus disseminans TaxID=1469910 RepID=A0A6A6ZHW9_9PLEO|nr:hypothetical protein CC86DRAFT_374938 [Ophiobolus disseminans]
MPSIKITVLALASAVAAVPHYGAHSSAHSRYHSKASAAHGTGNVKPYPTGGWPSAYNSTRAPYPTGTGAYDEDKTIDVTTTSTTTLVKTVVVKASPSPVPSVKPAGVDEGKCGPATITVTASEKVTVTVTPGGGADVPKSSVVAVESKSQGQGYNVPSSVVAPVSSTPKGEEAKPTPTPVVVPSSKVEQVYPTPTPVVASSKTPEAPSSKVEEYKVSSIVEKPVVSSAAASSAAPSKTPSSGGSYSGSKRGLAYNEASLCKTLGSKFGFAYNWGQVENNDVGAPYIPMMHRPSESTAEAWLKNVDKAVAKGGKAVMGFNEPDHAAQANLSPADACTAWKNYMNPIAASHPDVTIIGPSVTNGPPPMGIDWLSRFHDACPDAIVHATNIHFYDIYESATITRFKAQVEKAASLYGKPVWVTEFGLNPGSASQEQAATFLKEAMAYLDASDKVQGYSWFMVGSGENQLNSGTGLSAIGQLYAGGY